MLQKLTLIAVLALPGCVSNPAENVTDTSPQTTLDSLTQKLQPDLVKLEDVADENGLRLSQVVITLNTTVVDDEKGTIGLLVFKAGHETKVTNTSAFTITFEQPPDYSVRKSLGTSKFFAALVGIVENANKSLGDLTTSSVTGELKFALVQTGSGGIDIDLGDFDIVPLTVGLSKEVSNSYVQSIKVVLKRPAPESDEK